MAEELGVSLRTIQKDINERLGTIHDIVDLGHGDYKFADGYRLRSSENEDEKIAVSLMKSLQHSAIPELNDYIDSALPAATKYEEMFLFDLNLEPIEDIGTFQIILRAIKWRVSLVFTYT